MHFNDPTLNFSFEYGQGLVKYFANILTGLILLIVEDLAKVKHRSNKLEHSICKKHLIRAIFVFIIDGYGLFIWISLKCSFKKLT